MWSTIQKEKEFATVSESIHAQTQILAPVSQDMHPLDVPTLSSDQSQNFAELSSLGTFDAAFQYALSTETVNSDNWRKAVDLLRSIIVQAANANYNLTLDEKKKIFFSNKLLSEILYSSQEAEIQIDCYVVTLNALQQMSELGVFDPALVLRAARLALSQGDTTTCKHLLSLDQLHHSCLSSTLFSLQRDLFKYCQNERKRSLSFLYHDPDKNLTNDEIPSDINQEPSESLKAIKPISKTDIHCDHDNLADKILSIEMQSNQASRKSPRPTRSHINFRLLSGERGVLQDEEKQGQEYRFGQGKDYLDIADNFPGAVQDIIITAFPDVDVEQFENDRSLKLPALMMKLSTALGITQQLPVAEMSTNMFTVSQDGDMTVQIHQRSLKFVSLATQALSSFKKDYSDKYRRSMEFLDEISNAVDMVQACPFSSISCNVNDYMVQTTELAFEKSPANIFQDVWSAWKVLIACQGGDLKLQESVDRLKPSTAILLAECALHELALGIYGTSNQSEYQLSEATLLCVFILWSSNERAIPEHIPRRVRILLNLCDPHLHRLLREPLRLSFDSVLSCCGNSGLQKCVETYFATISFVYLPHLISSATATITSIGNVITIESLTRAREDLERRIQCRGAYEAILNEAELHKNNPLEVIHIILRHAELLTDIPRLAALAVQQQEEGDEGASYLPLRLLLLINENTGKCLDVVLHILTSIVSCLSLVLGQQQQDYMVNQSESLWLESLMVVLVQLISPRVFITISSCGNFIKSIALLHATCSLIRQPKSLRLITGFVENLMTCEDINPSLSVLIDSALASICHLSPLENATPGLDTELILSLETVNECFRLLQLMMLTQKDFAVKNLAADHVSYTFCICGLVRKLLLAAESTSNLSSEFIDLNLTTMISVSVLMRLTWGSPWGGKLCVADAIEVVYTCHEFICAYELQATDNGEGLSWLSSQLCKPLIQLGRLSGVVAPELPSGYKEDLNCPYYDCSELSPKSLKDLLYLTAEVHFVLHRFPLAQSYGRAGPDLSRVVTPEAKVQMYVLVALTEKIRGMTFNRNDIRSSVERLLLLDSCESFFLSDHVGIAISEGLFSCCSSDARMAEYANEVFNALHMPEGTDSLESITVKYAYQKCSSNLYYEAASHLGRYGGTISQLSHAKDSDVTDVKDSPRQNDRRRLTGCLQLLLKSLSLSPGHFDTWSNLAVTLHQLLNCVTDDIGDFLCLQNVPRGIMQHLVYLADEECKSAISDSDSSRQLERGMKVFNFYREEDEIIELRRICTLATIRSSSREGYDFNVLDEKPNSSVCPTSVINNDEQFHRVLDSICLKNSCLCAFRRVMSVLSHSLTISHLTLPQNLLTAAAPSLESIWSPIDYTNSLRQVFVYFGLTLYNLSQEYPKCARARQDLQAESLSAFSRAMNLMDQETTEDKLFTIMMVGKLKWKVEHDVKKSLELLKEAWRLAEDDRTNTYAKTEKVAAQYQFHSFCSRVAIRSLSNLLLSSSNSSGGVIAGFSNALDVTSVVPVLIEAMGMNSISSLNDSMPWQSSSLSPTTSKVGMSISSEDSTIKHLVYILENSIAGLRECRRKDSYETFSVYRISDIFYQLHKLKVASEKLSSEVHRSFLKESSELGCRLGFYKGFRIEEARGELQKLFDKRRPQIVALWFVEVSSSGYDQIFQRTYKYDALRSKIFGRYACILEECGSLTGLQTIATWACQSKGAGETVEIMLTDAVLRYTRLLSLQQLSREQISTPADIQNLTELEGRIELLGDVKVDQVEHPVSDDASAALSKWMDMLKNAFSLYRVCHRRLSPSMRKLFESELIRLYGVIGELESAASNCSQPTIMLDSFATHSSSIAEIENGAQLIPKNVTIPNTITLVLRECLKRWPVIKKAKPRAKRAVVEVVAEVEIDTSELAAEAEIHAEVEVGLIFSAETDEMGGAVGKDAIELVG